MYNVRSFHAKANSKWFDILTTLGISGEILDGRHHPCPVCGGKDRFRFDDKNGFGTWFCNQCSPQAGDGIKLIQKVFGLNFVDALREIDKVLDKCTEKPQPSENQPEPQIALNRLWKNSIPLKPDDVVSRYLKTRGLYLQPANIRYCKQCYEKETRQLFPAMVAKIYSTSQKPISIHRTYLTLDSKKRQDLEKAKRLMPGTESLHGSSIRLFLPIDTEHSQILGVAEGIETAIATTQFFKIATWACISSGLMKFWLPPKEFKEIVIFGDNDLNYCGQEAAFVLAKTLHYQGLRVHVKIPNKPGDWLDATQPTKTTKKELWE